LTHYYLVLPPLLVLWFALWRLWEPDRVPSFRLTLLALLLQLIYVADLFFTHGALPSLIGGILATGAMIFVLHRVVRAEQIQKRIEALRKDLHGE
jgi:hypothetical protein